MIDFQKFTKYSKSGPRYTSYPTALEFHENFNEQIYIKHLAEQDDKRNLSLYIHLPFCRSACYFCGCNVIFTSKEDKKERYIQYLKKEILLLKRYINTKRFVSQLHFGGGTPTFFSPAQFREIIDAIRDVFVNFTDDAEISCEVDPRFFSQEHMDVLKYAGCNRLSFGVQDLDLKVQEEIHRIQPYSMTQDVVKIAREAGINSINIDLIYGLPYQTKQSFHQTLTKILLLNPDRLAVFNYAHVPWMKKTMRKFDETTFSEPAVKLEILKDTIDTCIQSGYKMVGMDHFAKPTDELFKAITTGELHRNFQGYTTKGGSDLIGIGLTSIGNAIDYYAQNHKELEAYEQALDEDRLPIAKGYSLSQDDIIRQNVIMELMSNFSLNIERIEKQFNIDFKEYFSDALIELQEFVDDELIELNAQKISVSQTGTMLIRNIVMPFDAYLKKIPLEQRRFSKTV